MRSGANTLSELLIQVLSERPNLPVSELIRILGPGKEGYSQSAIYKEIGNLKQRGIVVRQRARFSLTLTWVLETMQYAERLRQVYLKRAYLGTFLPGAGARQVWRFRDLVSMDDFWNQMFLALVSQHEGDRVFSWVPHPWFVLIHADKEKRLHSVLRGYGKKFFTIFGGDSYLDHLAKKLYHRSIHSYSFAPGPFESEQGSYLDVVGEHVLTVKLPEALNRSIRRLFRTVTARSELDPLEIMQLLSARSSITVTLERNPRRAKRLSDKFEEYFGA